MRHFLLISILLMFTGNLYSMNIDSLKHEWNNPKNSDINRFDAVHSLVYDIYLKTDLDSAWRYINLELKFAEENNLRQRVGTSWQDLARYYRHKRDRDKAMEYYIKANNLWSEIGYRKGVAASYNNMAMMYYRKGLFDEALRCFDSTIAISKEIGNVEASLTVNRNVCVFLNREGKVEESLKRLENGYNVALEIKNEKIQADYCLAIASRMRTLGNLKGVKKYFQTGIGICKRINYSSGLTQFYIAAGVFAYDMGDYENALIHFKKAEELLLATTNKKELASLYNRIGILYQKKPDYIRALDYFDKAEDICLSHNYSSELSTIYNNLATIYSEQSDLEKALQYFEKSLEINTKRKNKKSIGLVLMNIGNIDRRMGRNADARKKYDSTNLIYKEIGYLNGQARVLEQYGALEFDQKNYAKAFSHFRNSLQIQESLNSKQKIASLSRKIGEVHFKIDMMDSALIYFTNSAEIAKEIGAAKIEKESVKCLLNLSIQQNSKTQSKKYLNRLIKLLENDIETNFILFSEYEKELYFKSIEKDYNYLFKYLDLFGKDDPEILAQAYNSIMQLKGLSLKSSTALRLSIEQGSDTSLVELYDEFNELKKEITRRHAQGKDNTALIEKVNTIERSLAVKSKLFNEYKNIKSLDWKQVQSSLQNGETAVEYIRYVNHKNETQYGAIVLIKNSPQPLFIKLCLEKELEQLMGRLSGNNQSIIEKLYGKRNNLETKLYSLIWKPLEHHLTKGMKIYVSPVGMLHRLSFPALGISSTASLSNEYPIQICMSTSSSVYQKKFSYSSDQKVTIFGAPYYNESEKIPQVWSYLPGTLAESEEIHKVLTRKNNEVALFSNNDATERNFRENCTNADVIHIATHGYFYPDPSKIENAQQTEYQEKVNFRGSENPTNKSSYGYWMFVNNKNPLMRTGLALNDANSVWKTGIRDSENDGVLSAQEVAQLNLSKNKLVVLSACETGLGDIKGNEGVYGLKRAFKLGGADFIIMSLWKVPDKETSEFMLLFYKNLTKIKDLRSAFGKTKSMMSKKYDPYFWAAFVLVE